MCSARGRDEGTELRRARRIERVTVGMLFLAAAAQYTWNAATVPPFSGYDVAGHAGYILTIVSERRLPHPMDPRQGWSTFHPPLYYLIGSVVWSVLEPLGPRALRAGLQGISAATSLAAGLGAYRLLRRVGAPWAISWVATAVLLFVPCVQLAAAWIGNEAVAYGIGALCLLPLLTMQRNPREVRAAALAGLLAGLTLASKFTGIFVFVACLVPFLHRDADRRTVRSLAVFLLVATAVAGPVYVRNALVAGTPFPILRGLEPQKSMEAAQVLRPRRLADYLWIDPTCLWRPSIYLGAPPFNPAMTNVWGLAYASVWYDAFGHRLPPPLIPDGVLAGRVLILLGIVPTATMLLGFGFAVRDAILRRGRSDDAPLVVLWCVGLATFVLWTWSAPSPSAVKGSYLLPLAVPGAVFFARSLTRLRPWARAGALVVSFAAAAAAALVFTNGLVFPPTPQGFIAESRYIGRIMPESHIGEAVNRLAPP